MIQVLSMGCSSAYATWRPEGLEPQNKQVLLCCFSNTLESQQPASSSSEFCWGRLSTCGLVQSAVTLFLNYNHSLSKTKILIHQITRYLCIVLFLNYITVYYHILNLFRVILYGFRLVLIASYIILRM